MVNTFHLYLQLQMKVIKKAGGLHNFINYFKPLMSDSGGFQVFSLIHNNPKMGKINDQEVEFRSPLDGSIHNLSPEKSIQIQFDLGTDIMVCLDDCPPHSSSQSNLEKAVYRTTSWAKRAKKEYQKQLKKRQIKDSDRPILLAVIQGGLNIKLRQECAQALVEIDFDAYGLGARPVDEKGNYLSSILKETAKAIPEKAWRFALGVGMPNDIYHSYLLGWDAFDCVIPSREGRHGRLFYFQDSFQGFKFNKNNNLNNIKIKYPEFYNTINIKNKIFSTDFSPINSNSQLKVLRNYNKAFLHHLFRLNDPLGQKLASLNNLEFYQKLMLYLCQLK
jgi:queuine tRNA-ribosyltransferase